MIGTRVVALLDLIPRYSSTHSSAVGKDCTYKIFSYIDLLYDQLIIAFYSEPDLWLLHGILVYFKFMEEIRNIFITWWNGLWCETQHLTCFLDREIAFSPTNCPCSCCQLFWVLYCCCWHWNLPWKIKSHLFYIVMSTNVWYFGNRCR